MHHAGKGDGQFNRKENHKNRGKDSAETKAREKGKDGYKKSYYGDYQYFNQCLNNAVLTGLIIMQHKVRLLFRDNVPAGLFVNFINNMV